jgi:leader peptidase (prepilin peptidase)/N-methyltransferase
VEILLLVFAGALGAVVGSFLNVCIHRLPIGRSIVTPRSACPSCGRAIAWHDNVPVLSFALLGGRCRGCRAPIAWRYPLVEAATAALFVLAARRDGPTPLFFVDAAFVAALVVLMLIDAEHQILPDAITLPGIVVGLLTSPVRGAYDPEHMAGPLAALRGSLQAAALGYAIPWTLNAAYHGWQAIRRVPRDRREDGIGRGDFKLLAMIGAFLGIPLLLFTIFAGALSGAAYGIAMMWRRGYGWRSRLPFGVFLGGAAIAALFLGSRAVGWYLGVAGVTP